MSEFLYKELDGKFVRPQIQGKEFYDFVSENLNQNFELREYQIEAFKRFFYYYELENYRNLHICYNMATGSGKTLIMAGLMLYLYEKGYRNFLFFVNRTQIIEKTKDNFINENSPKFLFNENVKFNGKIVKIKAVENFANVDSECINICFSTIQSIFNDMNNEKENSLTLNDFENQKVVLIADEAHHINAKTKKGQGKLEFGASWENTIEQIFYKNAENILLEFSATFELSNENIKQKYKDKILFYYDLKNFVEQKYSKEIYLLRSDVDMKTRMLQAVIVSLYRQKVAEKYRINLKPVVLFKSKAIKNSKQNQEIFENLVQKLDAKELENFKNQNKIKIIDKIFKFFEAENLDLKLICDILKVEFASKNIISTNDDNELKSDQKILNNLENNAIRAIFSVDKLNEGWDVLNLFDIVRLYEGQNSGGTNAKSGKIGKTTISEAQLIGRGARYYPFGAGSEKFRRKFDDDLGNEKRILESLFYYSENESRYIAELRNALAQIGIITKDEKKKYRLKLKPEFENFNQAVYKNKEVPKSYKNVKFTDLVLGKTKFTYNAKSGVGSLDAAFGDSQSSEKQGKFESRNLVEFCGKNIIKNAILFDEYFCMKNLGKILPDLASMDDFVAKNLAIFEIFISGEKFDYKEKLNLAVKFLEILKDELKRNTFENAGSLEFEKCSFSEIFTEKEVQISAQNSQEIEVESKPWSVYENFYGSGEEKNFIEFFEKIYAKLQKKFGKNEIFLVRNERQLAIYNFTDGMRFEPDFLLFLKDENFSYQIFIEPKGEMLLKNDAWKEEFLKEISKKKGKLIIKDKNFVILGLKFYNKNSEKNFENDMIAENLL